MIKITFKLKSPSTPYTLISLSRRALIHNFQEFQKLSPAIAPVLKSNAYGHGLIDIAKLLSKEKIPFFIIDSYEEAIALRQNKITNPILVIGYIQAETVNKSTQKNISFAVTSLDMLYEWQSRISKKTNVHIKIDTGMNRQGISLSQISQSIELIKKSPTLKLEGLYSHFSDAGNTDSTYTNIQIEAWNSAVDIFKTNFTNIRYFHVSNSAGHGYNEKISANVTRPGMGLYGFAGNGKVDSLVHLKPVLELTTVISGLKNIEPNSKVGYSGTYISDSAKKIAIIPVGYDTGVDRRLSNKGVVKIGNNFAKIIGLVSMNTTIIDVTEIKDVKLGSPVTVISSDARDQNSIMNIARECGTIPDDIATNINPFLSRIIKD
ncbi:MAG: alanine racemase [bacterium]|nr:alanine racemase [bacterium]